MAYDVARARTVLFGGGPGSAPLTVFGDTWEWNGSTWTQRQTGAAPAARWAFCMVADIARGRIVLHGGSNQFSTVPPTFNDTWAFDGSRWTQVSTTNVTPPRMAFAMAYDWSSDQIVLFGDDPFTNDTWVLVDDTWVRDTLSVGPPPRVGPGLAADVNRGRLVMFGGWLVGDTWEYTPRVVARWTTTAPGCQGGSGLPVLQRLAGSRPVLGSTFQLELGNVPTPGFGAVAIGFSEQSWNGMSLPMSLSGLGLPGCDLRIAPETLVGTVPANGRVTVTLPLPATGALTGTRFFTQGVVLDQTANSFGALLSNAGVGTLGSL